MTGEPESKCIKEGVCVWGGGGGLRVGVCVGGGGEVVVAK